MLKNEEIKLIYRSLGFLDKLTKKEQDQVLLSVSRVKYEEGENIHGGINTCSGIIIIKKGCLRSYLLSEEGKEVTLYLLKNGDNCVLSASCAMTSITFDIQVDSELDTEVLIVDLKAIKKISDNIYLENFLLNETVMRFSEVIWAMEKILFLKFDQRLAIFLLDEISRNSNEIIVKTQEQIAKHLGSAREVVSRMLNYFADEGIVELSRGQVRVKNKQALRELIKY